MRLTKDSARSVPLTYDLTAGTGEAVSMVQVGDRVSMYHAPSCGHCEACARGEWFNCTTIGQGYRLGQKVHGADADYLLDKIPDPKAAMEQALKEIEEEAAKQQIQIK